MSDEHHHGPVEFNRAFAIGIALNTGFVAVEAFYGWKVDSLALLADAGHNLSDVVGLVLAWGGVLAGRIRPNARHTYGWKRASILAAFANALLLLVAMGSLAWEAIGRLSHPSPVQGSTIMAVAGIGIVINTATALLFMKGREHDLNIRGAFLHMAADAVVSAGVVISGLAIMLTGMHWIDPVVSLIIAVVILVSTWGLLRDSVNLAMDHVPESINVEVVRTYLTGLPGVTEVHDLHIWALSTTEIALTVHLVRPSAGTDDALLERVGSELQKRFGIGHATLQVEDGAPCALAPLDVV